jgi:FPC/CPF motif-containing protein YcgG
MSSLLTLHGPAATQTTTLVQEPAFVNQHATMPLLRKFKSRIQEPLFPCVGAKSAMAQNGIGFVMGGDLRAPEADAQIVMELQYFARDIASDAVFVSKVVLFPSTPSLDEQHFEAAMWQRLQAFHAIDAASHDWDPEVSSDPESPHFSMSIGGRGFYVIGLHPDASRTARRFHCAALVFNLHSQFEALRADGRYDKLRASITERDIAFSGSRNPMLATHGVSSEARQYSGRQVDSDWRCPFNATNGGRRDAA